MKSKILLTVFLLLSVVITAQENVSENEEENRPSIGVLIGHSAVLQGVKDGERQSIYVPAFALQYNYAIAEKFALGLHLDTFIETFTIKKSGGTEIERERPVATTIVGSYEFARRFAFILGGGVEWEKNENFGLLRFGLDYTHPLGENGFEFVSTLNSDILFGGYNTINLAVGVAKTF